MADNVPLITLLERRKGFIMRTVATFESQSFNLTEDKEYLKNEGCFGDDLGRWLIERLRATGAEAEAEPGQEDFGWYVNFSVRGQPFCAVIGNVGGEFWFVAVERVVGFLNSISGGRNRNVPAEGVQLIHRVLSSASEVRNLQWHEWSRFRKGGADAFAQGTPAP